jgi:predicted lipoprotein with Yx(FWY)xxD motif
MPVESPTRYRGARVAALLALLAVAGCAVAAGAFSPAGARASANAGVPTGSAWRFQSAPTLQPPKVTVLANHGGLAPGYVFLDPFKDFAATTAQVGQAGALIVDNHGNPEWFQPAPRGDEILNFQAQSYNGKPVLTWWQGKLALPGARSSSGAPAGSPLPGADYQIYDQHYHHVASVSAQDGWTADEHEFLITSQGDALFPVARTVTQNLSTYGTGGTSTDRFEDSGIQEVDIATGKVVFTWDMASAVSLSQSAIPVPATGVWDPYHLNSIDIGRNGTLLISARSTWSLYDITPTAPTGHTVNWTLDAKPNATDSSFALGTGAAFSWQHDARLLPGGEISLFDDHCCAFGQPIPQPPPSSRGLVLKLDSAAKTATVVASYPHSPPLSVPSQGDLQILPDGHAFVGWGQLPYYSEYTAAGTLLYDVALPAADESYRTERFVWTGEPLTHPALTVMRAGSRVTAYASWNGATTVARWELEAGASQSSLPVVARAAHAGFETAIDPRGTAAFYRVVAVATNGKVLASSGIVRPRTVTATTTIATRSTAHLGHVLATSRGVTLYSFSRDGRNRSTCSGLCAEKWHPLLASGGVRAAAGSGVQQRLLGTIPAGHGRRQIVYAGHPLYTFVLDTKAGELTGEGASQFGGHWYVLSTAGKPLKPKNNGGTCQGGVVCGY